MFGEGLPKEETNPKKPNKWKTEKFHLIEIKGLWITTIQSTTNKIRKCKNRLAGRRNICNIYKAKGIMGRAQCMCVLECAGKWAGDAHGHLRWRYTNGNTPDCSHNEIMQVRHRVAHMDLDKWNRWTYPQRFLVANKTQFRAFAEKELVNLPESNCRWVLE